MIFRVHQESQRDFERIVDLGGVDVQIEARLDTRQRRQNAEAEPGRIQIEIADRLDKLAIETDFLFGLAQRRIERRVIGRIDLAAGK